jgi:hypothetical protein
MECHKCPDYMKHHEEEWANTPCAKCQLREDSFGTFPYREADAANASWDHNPDDEHVEAAELAEGQNPATLGTLDTEDPSFPLSVLADAMSLWVSLSLPARKVFQMRMEKLPYSAIGERLGCSRQAAEKLVAQVIAKDVHLNNLLPEKRKRPTAPLTATRNPAIADSGTSPKKRIRASQKPHFVPNNETRTA